MKSPPELLQIIEKLCRQLTNKNDEYQQLAENKADAEKEYKMAVREQILRHKADGQPVTLIIKLVEGHKAVAELKFQMDVKEALVKANLESVKSTVTQIDAVRSMLTWLRAEMGG